LSHINAALLCSSVPKLQSQTDLAGIERKLAMETLRQSVMSLAAGFALFLSATAAAAATAVSVDLWDKGADVEMPTGLVYGAPGLDHVEGHHGD
jgi:hypothetical protein